MTECGSSGSGRRLSKRHPDDPRVPALAQERLWYLDQLAPNNPVYNVPFVSRLQGELDATIFERALNAVVERHEVLRTVFLPRQGAPVPIVIKDRRLKLNYADLRHLPESQREEEAQKQIKDRSSRPFNLARDLMLRVSLFHLSDRDYLLFHDSHHIAFEGSSVEVLYRELAAFYDAWICGKEPALPEMELQYADFAAWQRRLLTPERVAALKNGWKQALDGAPAWDPPLDFPRPPVHTMRGTRRSFSLAPELLSEATAFFQQSGTTSFRGFCAAFNVFLYCYTGQIDLSLGSPFPPNCRGIDDLIGFFVNTVVLRTVFQEDWTFRRLMRRVDTVVHRAYAGSDLPFNQIVDAVHPPRDPSRTPLFQVNFRVTSRQHAALQLRNVTGCPAEYVDNGTAKFDLALDIQSSTGRGCYFEYCTDLFKEETIRRMEIDFADLLRALVREPDTPLHQLSTVAGIAARVRQGRTG